MDMTQTDTTMMEMMAYAVLTSLRARRESPLSTASINLLRNPLPMPMSKKLSHATSEDMVSQMPYA